MPPDEKFLSLLEADSWASENSGNYTANNIHHRSESCDLLNMFVV